MDDEGQLRTGRGVVPPLRVKPTEQELASGPRVDRACPARRRPCPCSATGEAADCAPDDDRNRTNGGQALVMPGDPLAGRPGAARRGAYPPEHALVEAGNPASVGRAGRLRLPLPPSRASEARAALRRRRQSGNEGLAVADDLRGSDQPGSVTSPNCEGRARGGLWNLR